MQTFSAKKNNRATMIRPYELALYCVQGYDIWQETPEEKRLARPGHPEDLALPFHFSQLYCCFLFPGSSQFLLPQLLPRQQIKEPPV